jgi:arylsulfatase A-like enzyme
MTGGGAGRAGRSFMVRTKDYKYALLPGAERTELLFDLPADPGEMKNLAADKSAAAELKRHRELLAEWRKTTDEDHYPLPAGRQAKGKRAKSGKVNE